MKRRKKLTPAEWEIMEAIWKLNGSPSVRMVWETVAPKKEKAYTTVQTVMNTLEKKGVLTRAKIGLVNFYKPVQSRDEVVRQEISGVALRIFDGSMPALANYLIRSQDLDLEEIEKIKVMLDQKEKKLRSPKP